MRQITVIPKSFKFSLLSTDSVILDHVVRFIRRLIVTRVALLTAFVVPQQNECHSASYKTSVISILHGNSNFSIFSTLVALI
jgi:hypothetical protein